MLMPDVAFTIYNRVQTELYPMTGYSLPFEIFKFLPNFSSVPTYISDKKVVWNFGDGTISSNLSGFHYYKYPGVYPVTLTVFDSAGNSSVSTVLSTIKVYNFINDAIILTTNAVLNQDSGAVNQPIFLTRYNSWQTSISGDNRVIKLAVSGNKSQFFNQEEYNANPYSHLYPSSKFVLSAADGYTVIDAVTTTNVDLYATPLSSGEVTVSTVSADGSSYAGSKGEATFFYVEDFKT